MNVVNRQIVRPPERMINDKKISLEQLTHKIKSEIPKKGILYEELICSSKRSLTFIQMYMFAGKSINSEMMF